MWANRGARRPGARRERPVTKRRREEPVENERARESNRDPTVPGAFALGDGAICLPIAPRRRVPTTVPSSGQRNPLVQARSGERLQDDVVGADQCDENRIVGILVEVSLEGLSILQHGAKAVDAQDVGGAVSSPGSTR